MATVLLSLSESLSRGYGVPVRQGQTAGTASPVISDSYLENRKSRPARRQSRRAKSTPAIARIRELIYPWVYGTKVDGLGVRPSHSKDAFLALWNGGGIDRIRRLANYRLIDHINGDATHYYWSRPDSRFILAMIDIDVSKSLGLGSRTGAKDFADKLDKLVPGCHWEPSTNGQGMHGYILIDLGEDFTARTADEVKGILGRFEADLRTIQRHERPDIELVEVKGRPPVIDTPNDPRMQAARRIERIDRMTYGTFAKLPRNLDAIMSLVPHTVDALARIADHVPDVVIIDETKPKAKIAGSCTGKHISDAMLGLLPDLERDAEKLMAGRTIMAGSAKVTPQDLAIVMLLSWFFAKGNTTQAMPTARFKGMWDALYAADDITRGWSAARFIACRNLLTDEGLIKLVDATYAHREGGGGKCCRWGLSDEAQSRIDHMHEVIEAGPTAGTGSPVISGFCLENSILDLPRTGDWWRPVDVSYVRAPVRPTRRYVHEYSMAA